MNHEGLYGQIRTAPQFIIGCCFCVGAVNDQVIITINEKEQ